MIIQKHLEQVLVIFQLLQYFNFGFYFRCFSMPSEADFSDVAPDANIDLTSLAPLTPAVAEFENAIDVTIDISALAPVTPAADFE